MLVTFRMRGFAFLLFSPTPPPPPPPPPFFFPAGPPPPRSARLSSSFWAKAVSTAFRMLAAPCLPTALLILARSSAVVGLLTMDFSEPGSYGLSEITWASHAAASFFCDGGDDEESPSGFEEEEDEEEAEGEDGGDGVSLVVTSSLHWTTAVVPLTRILTSVGCGEKKRPEGKQGRDNGREKTVRRKNYKKKKARAGRASPKTKQMKETTVPERVPREDEDRYNERRREGRGRGNEDKERPPNTIPPPPARPISEATPDYTEAL